MAETLTGSEWVAAIDEHYFADYLPAGGSSVKFAVCSAGVEPGEVIPRLQARALERGFLVAHVDAAQTKVHMIEQVFGKISEQTPWQAIIDRTLLRFAQTNQWMTPAAFTDEGIVAQLDRLNQIGEQQMSLVLQREIGQEIFLNRRLAKDFRVAMSWMARERLQGGFQNSTTYRQLTDWMAGRVCGRHFCG